MAVDAFIPTLWSKKFKDVLDPALVYANCLNRDYEGEIKNMGDTVRVNTIGPVTISPYVTNTLNLLPEQIQGAGQPMVIDQANYFYFALDDVNKAQINVNVMEQAIRRASFGMRDTIDEYLSALLIAGVHEDNVLEYTGVLSSTFANPIALPAATPALTYELLVDLSTRLNKANVPGADRWCIVPPDFVGRLLKDGRFTSFATSGAFENIKAGSSAGGEDGQLMPMLRMLTGFDVYVSNQVPVGGAGNSVFAIVCGYKGAASFATQIAEGQPEAFRLQTGFADAVRGLQLYGAKVFEPAGLASAYIQFT